MSTHAKQRCSQRNISAMHVDYILAHGTEQHRTGITFFILRRRDIPAPDRKVDRYRKLAGTTLLVTQNNRLVTGYRNPKAHRDVLKKDRYRRYKSRSYAHDKHVYGIV